MVSDKQGRGFGKDSARLALQRRYSQPQSMLHLDRGQMEVKLALQKNGIPTLLYEANMADRSEFDEKGILRRIDIYMDSRGLQKLED